jgi:heterodisulfide reductase subunit A-like polyferredoxin
MGEKNKISIILCNCGNSLTKKLDWNKLSKAIKEKEEIITVEETSWFCQAEEQKKILSKIKEKGGEKIIVVGCSPKLYEEKLTEIMKELELNPQLLVGCNLREHIIWTSGNKAKAIEDILPAIESSIARATALEIIEEEKLPINRRVLIIGGGIAGMQTALELSTLGIKSTIVEREANVGGKILKLNSFYESNINPDEFINSKIDELKNNENVELLTQAEIIKLQGYPGNFTATISQGEEKREENFGAVVVATGYQLLFPNDLYHIALSEKVTTQFQLEEILKNPEENPLLKQLNEKSLVIFLTGMIGEDSKLTTAATIKNALLLKTKYNCHIFIASQQVKVASQPLERMYRNAREKGIIFFKYTHQHPVIQSSNSKPVITLLDPLLSSGEIKNPKIKIPCDLLVLEEKLIPDYSIAYILKWLGVDTDSRGFFQRENVNLLPTNSNRKGIYIVGSARTAMSIPEVVADSSSAALNIYRDLSQETQLVTKSKAVINKGLCALCLTCIRHCPHGAITYDRAAVIIEASCQGCGICASECPASAIEIRNYTSDQMLIEMKNL